MKGADVWVREGKVIDPQRLFYVEKLAADRVVDCHGLIVAPGFIDIQINGERYCTRPNFPESPVPKSISLYIDLL